MVNESFYTEVNSDAQVAWSLTVGAVVSLVGAAGMTIVMLVGLGAGTMLNRLVPSIDLGMSTLIGALAFLSVVYVLVQFVHLAIQTQSFGEASNDEAPADNVMSNEQVEVLGERLAEALLEHSQWSRSKRGRRARSPASPA